MSSLCGRCGCCGAGRRRSCRLDNSSKPVSSLLLAARLSLSRSPSFSICARFNLSKSGADNSRLGPPSARGRGASGSGSRAARRGWAAGGRGRRAKRVEPVDLVVAKRCARREKCTRSGCHLLIPIFYPVCRSPRAVGFIQMCASRRRLAARPARLSSERARRH